MSKRLLVLLALLLAALACNLPDFIPLPAPEITPTELPTFSIPSETPLPTMTSEPTITPTPGVAIAFPKDEGVHCRVGPGKEWEAISSLVPGTNAKIVGRTSETTWWLIEDPLNPGKLCWVAYEVVDTAGNLDTVRIVPPPTASITKVTVNAEVAFSACGGPNPIGFSGSITADGPTTVSYHWEVGDDKQHTTPDESITFVKAGTQDVIASVYKADCGNYFVILHVTIPNEKAAKQNFKVGP